MGKKVYVNCELEWAKLRPEDRDMGPQDGSDMAKNFDEAIKAVNAALVPTRISSQVKDILDDPSCTGLTSEVRKDLVLF